ncbi:MAG: amidohydrolase family protein [Pseudomonadota bacterium]
MLCKIKTGLIAFMLLHFSAPTLAVELLVDTHIHYSHDAWERTPPVEAVEILRRAGLKRAFVSSSSDEGTQKLYAIAPELVVPVLRPYRKRGETSSWMHDASVVPMLRDLLERNYYAGIGEFHAFGDDINLPVMQSVIALAKHHQIFLHAHSDAEAIDLIFDSNPDALVLWAHSGFDDPDEIAPMLEKYPNLWADLAYRYEHEVNGAVDSEWLKLFKRFPNRFMLGTDTFTPEAWYYVIEQAKWSRGWLSSLPADLANRIAFGNAENLLARVKK